MTINVFLIIVFTWHLLGIFYDAWIFKRHMESSSKFVDEIINQAEGGDIGKRE